MTQLSTSCALLSVSDKTGIEKLGAALIDHGLTLLSTGGTAVALRNAGLAVTDVSEHTGAEEMMAGRVKTLHPTIHGGILGRRGVDNQVMSDRAIAPIDVVVVNLYPFASTVAREDVTFEDAIENIDIGGPAMVRSAAKNHASVSIVTDPSDYPRFIESLSASAEDQHRMRFDLAVKAFEHTAAYDGMIANFFGRRTAADASHENPTDFPRTLNTQFHLNNSLRYGENPHQRAAFYRLATAGPGTLAAAALVQGKALSYNNVMDADAALECVRQFTDPACVIVKHANPCGVAVGADLLDAYEKAYKTDPTSAFGGIIAFNHVLSAAVTEQILKRQFVEVIIAPGVDADALPLLAAKPNVRVLDCETLVPTDLSTNDTLQYRPISGGLLVQDNDQLVVQRDALTVVSDRQPSNAELADLLFTWRVAKYVKSNAIVYGRDAATVGVGAGQMSRVYSARIAGIKAADEGLQVEGAVMASDAFFPFRDGIDNAAAAGIVAVIQPGGSKNDQEVIDAANEHGMAMVFTGVRHFRH